MTKLSGDLYVENSAARVSGGAIAPAIILFVFLVLASSSFAEDKFFGCAISIEGIRATKRILKYAGGASERTTNIR
ncbi:hypothetical protein [uncultured Nostoc sp.]|uniref:hypothetical protein n=1 Tax=uncultured Nostoc sp. TaxID=340711 RepID=UPI0035CA06E0